MNKTQKVAIYGLFLVGLSLISLVDLVNTKVNPGLLPVAALCYGFAVSLSTLIQYGRGLPPPPHLSYDRKTQERDEAAGGKQNE